MTSATQSVVRKNSESLFKVRNLTIIGMLSAIAVVLMLFEFPLWFAPAFYKIDISELPVIIGAFMLGPVAGIVIELVKILLNFLVNSTTTAGIGELANFIMGCAFVVPAAIIYKRKKTKKYAIIGLLVGTISLAVIGGILNAYVLLPTYAVAFNMPIEQLVAAGTAVNSGINSLGSFILLAVTPFNLLKGIIVSGITLIIYKKISIVFKRLRV